MRYGFIMDQEKCIGCHACTIACKAEHDIPLGAFRTWVSYVERGEFPNTRRFFQVNRCNHCDNAPCVAICPTEALFKRPDGIVDFDQDKCIGCKACMEACPYDAIYIDPTSHTAAKCNYCAHRIDQGLLPACVVVCPEEAIIAGDLDDPQSLIAQRLAREPVQVRKPEQGTRPNVFYIGADEATLNPTLATAAGGYMWAQAPDVIPLTPVAQRREHVRATKVLDTPHNRRPWGWMVSSYLWTKSLAAGSAMLAALGALHLDKAAAAGPLTRWVNPLLALLFLGATLVLLVGDLKRPERFWRLLLRPHRTSWLVWGGYILTAFGGWTALWLILGIAGASPGTGVLPFGYLLLAAAAAGYTAFLFGQAEGRDFWQSPLVFWHLLVQASLAGGALAALEGALGGGRGLLLFGMRIVVAAIVVHLAIALGELLLRHSTHESALAAHEVTRGQLRRVFWGLAVAAGAVLPLAVAVASLVAASAPLGLLAALLALGGLAAYEHVWVVAGQTVPLS